ncbi:MAG TPA: penicillin-binding protein 2 [Gaiellaceae bacterium]
MAERNPPSRRFLPPDPRVEEPYRLTPQIALRIAILGFLALALFAVLFLRLWALQMLSGDKYRAQANENRARTIRLDAPRGTIIDRKGRVLVRNVIGTSVELWPADLPKSREARLAVLRRLALVVRIPEQQLLERLREHAADPLTPVVVRRGIRDDQYWYIKEHQSQFPGVQLAETYLRKYPYRTLAAHVLGHVGEIDAEELQRMKRLGYQLGDVIGQAGVEANYDRYLRGQDGTAQLTVDSRGRPTSAIEVMENSQPGNTLRLTLDIRLQRTTEEALRYGIALAHGNGAWAADGGAIVALDPRDGAVLALASYPTFDPSVYVSRDPRKLAPLQQEDVARLKNHPGLNRALSVTYPPGSTWKPVTALAGMQEHILSPYSSLLCSPSFTAYGQKFDNWTPYVSQWIELPSALAQSCDTYFYQVGLDFYELPPERGHALQQWASRFGFGAPTGIDVGPESAGLVPTPEWRRKQFAGPSYTEIDRTWKPGYSIQLAIGQGDLDVTPMQMTRFYAMVANGGQLVTPHLVEDVEQPSSDPRSRQVLRLFAPAPPRPSGVDPAALAVVRRGLDEATHAPYGTSSGVFGAFPVSIAGKTGTAEKLISLPGYPDRLKLDQSWWCGYGPTDAPTIAVCVVIENGGHGGTAAAPAALKVFEKYFKKRGVITDHPSD